MNGWPFPLPLRWLAPEKRAQLLSAQKNASTLSINESLWSLGVTLWEVGSLCGALPFASITDEAFEFRIDDASPSNLGAVHIKASHTVTVGKKLKITRIAYSQNLSSVQNSRKTFKKIPFLKWSKINFA